MKNHLMAVALCFAVTGCMHYKYTTTAKGGTAAPDVTHAGFVVGLIEQAPVEIGKICPGGFAQVESQQTVVDGIIAAITAHIYVPNHVTVTCVEGSQPVAQP
jgi:hypothetical protein